MINRCPGGFGNGFPPLTFDVPACKRELMKTDTTLLEKSEEMCARVATLETENARLQNEN